MRGAQERARRVIAPLARFVQSQSSSGALLLVATLVALVWANSPLGSSYGALWGNEFSFSLGGRDYVFDALHAVNDGLMALFFLLVGLEIKREFLVGELSGAKSAALPVIAAVGGMLVPALVFLALNPGQPQSRGWGVPMATDIAFSLGVLSLFGARVPLGIKVFLTALAIVDDLGAVLVVALFYTRSVDTQALLVCAGAVGLLAGLNLLRVKSLWPYLALGVVLWAAFLQSGVHTAIAGVVLAMAIPARTKDEGEDPPLQRLEQSLHTPVNYVVVPLFALANAGVVLAGVQGDATSVRAALGVLLGLFVGKVVGISLFSWLSVRLKVASLPSATGWGQVVAVGFLGGIGFTMSLFIAGLAFPGGALSSAAKLGILVGSALSGLVGALLLRRCAPLPDAPSVEAKDMV